MESARSTSPLTAGHSHPFPRIVQICKALPPQAHITQQPRGTNPIRGGTTFGGIPTGTYPILRKLH